MFNSLDIREVQIRTMVRYRFTLLEWLLSTNKQTNKQTKKENNKCGGNTEKMEPSGIAGENVK